MTASSTSPQFTSLACLHLLQGLTFPASIGERQMAGMRPHPRHFAVPIKTRTIQRELIKALLTGQANKIYDVVLHVHAADRIYAGRRTGRSKCADIDVRAVETY